MYNLNPENNLREVRKPTLNTSNFPVVFINAVLNLSRDILEVCTFFVPVSLIN